MDLTLSLTHACNLGCPYCYAGPSLSRTMPWDVCEQALRFAFSFPADSVQLGFFGGEPLLAWDLLQRATELAEEHARAADVRLRPVVTTNGTLLRERHLEWLVQHGFQVAISIDGNRAMHEITRPLLGGGSSFDATLRGLERVCEALDDPEVIAVVDPANVEHLADGLRFLALEKGATNLSVNPNFSADWSGEAGEALARAWAEVGELYCDAYRAGINLRLNVFDAKIIGRLKGGFEACDRCNFGQSEIAVAPSGRLYPCERLIGSDDDFTLCVGTVFDGFDEAKRMAIVARRGNVDPTCAACEVRDRCMNWCGCVNYATTGAIDRAHGALCLVERQVIQAADKAAMTLFAEGNPTFFRRFYYDDLG